MEKATDSQSKPPLGRQESDTPSDTSAATSGHRQLPNHNHKHKPHHVVGRHPRVPSSKGLHKYHQPAQTNRPRQKVASPEPEHETSDLSLAAAAATAAIAPPSTHRRTTSEVKLPRQSSTSNLTASLSHTNLKRNKSHGEVSRRNKSSDKLKRLSGGATTHQARQPKTHVQFDLGIDDPEDEWVDASETNSPYLSRKGSIVSSGQSSHRPFGSAENSRPETPLHQPEPAILSPERERVVHREYLTSRLLQRAPSHGAPPKMSSDVAHVTPPPLTPESSHRDLGSNAGSHGAGLTSRFVESQKPDLTSQGSFYHSSQISTVRSDETSRKAQSQTNLAKFRAEAEAAQTATRTYDDDSALVPRAARRSLAQPAETSRIQQKLNLQRASSTIEPGHNAPGASGVMGTSPLIGVGGPGYDGVITRDPRVSKLVERTSMEYSVVRRYLNPIARSANRLKHLPGNQKMQRIPRTNTGLTNGRRSIESRGHSRKVSMDPHRPVTPRRVETIGSNGNNSSFEGDEDGRLAERLSGITMDDGDEDGTAALLRNLWEKSPDLSASTD